MVQQESGETRLCDVSHIQRQTGYMNIEGELADFYSILEAVLLRFGKRTGQMWMKSVAATVYTNNALQGTSRKYFRVYSMHQLHQGLLQEELKYE